MFDFSSRQADIGLNVSNTILIIAAVLVVIGTWGNVLFSSIREKYSDERISKNETVTANANLLASKANERAAELELETLRLKQELSWREITDTQALTLIESLSDKPISIGLSWLSNDTESTNYARQLANILSRAGIKIVPHVILSINRVPIGLILCGVPSAQTNTLLEAFKAANIPIELNSDMPGLEIFVGQKPR